MKNVTPKMLTALIILGSQASLAADNQVEQGQQQFQYWCATCHGPGLYEGRYLPGTASLMNKYNGQLPGVLEERSDLSAEYVKTIIRQGSEGMPFFRKTEISDQQLEAIAAYLSRN